MVKSSYKQKKEWAKELYLSGEYNQKEIAAKVGVAEKTISKWVNDPDENWDDLKANFLITKEQLLKHTYAQINAVYEEINNREKGKQFPSSKEADVLAKLSGTIKNLEQDLSISQTIDVFVEFSNWLKMVDMEKAKEFINLQDGFIKSKLAGK